LRRCVPGGADIADPENTYWSGNVLDLLLALILKDKGQPIANVVVNRIGVLLTWIELHDDIKNSLTLQSGLQAVVRRLAVSIGLFGIPILAYLFEDHKQPANIPELFGYHTQSANISKLFGNHKQSVKVPESYALAWGAACALSLLILIEGLITLFRHANREKKTSSDRY